MVALVGYSRCGSGGGVSDSVVCDGGVVGSDIDEDFCGNDGWVRC